MTSARVYSLDIMCDGPRIQFEAASDRAAKGMARRAITRRGYRIDSTFVPADDDEAEEERAVQGWNLGAHEGCRIAVLVTSVDAEGTE